MGMDYVEKNSILAAIKNQLDRVIKPDIGYDVSCDNIRQVCQSFVNHEKIYKFHITQNMAKKKYTIRVWFSPVIDDIGLIECFWRMSCEMKEVDKIISENGVNAMWEEAEENDNAIFPTLWVGFSPLFWRLWKPCFDYNQVSRVLHFHWLFLSIEISW